MSNGSIVEAPFTASPHHHGPGSSAARRAVSAWTGPRPVGALLDSMPVRLVDRPSPDLPVGDQPGPVEEGPGNAGSGWDDSRAPGGTGRGRSRVPRKVGRRQERLHLSQEDRPGGFV